MRKPVSLLLLILMTLMAPAQLKITKPVKKKRPLSTTMSFGAGVSRSVLFLEQNTKHDNEAQGFSFYMGYGLTNVIHSTLEYTRYRTIDIQPTWYDIKAWTAELNFRFRARFPNWNAYAYPIAGLSINQFSGYFTGQNDYKGLTLRYGSNTNVITTWAGLNMGGGYEHHFGRFSGFIDFKMRVGMRDGLVYRMNIMDVFYGAGVKYNFKVRTFHSLITRRVDGTRKRYFLDTEE